MKSGNLMSAAAYLEQCGRTLELREIFREILEEGIFKDQVFTWIDRARTANGETARKLIEELLNRQPPASVAELEGMLIRVLEYHLQYAGGV